MNRAKKTDKPNYCKFVGPSRLEENIKSAQNSFKQVFSERKLLSENIQK